MPVRSATTGSGVIGTVIVNAGPVHVVASLEGVTVYTTFNVPPVRFSYVSVISSTPSPADFIVNPLSAEAVHVYDAGIELPSSTLSCGSKVNDSSEHTEDSTLAIPKGSNGSTVIIAVHVAVLLELSVTVIVTVTSLSLATPVPESAHVNIVCELVIEAIPQLSVLPAESIAISASSRVYVPSISRLMV